MCSSLLWGGIDRRDPTLNFLRAGSKFSFEMAHFRWSRKWEIWILGSCSSRSGLTEVRREVARGWQYWNGQLCLIFQVPTGTWTSKVQDSTLGLYPSCDSLADPSSFSLSSATSAHVFNACPLVLAGKEQAWPALLCGQREELGQGCTMKETLLNSFCPSCYQGTGLWRYDS